MMTSSVHPAFCRHSNSPLLHPQFPSPKRPHRHNGFPVTPMKLHIPPADVCSPNAAAPEAARARITHLGIGAHQDHLEFMAFHGTEACYHSDNDWFRGVPCPNGSGCA